MRRMDARVFRLGWVGALAGTAAAILAIALSSSARAQERSWDAPLRQGRAAYTAGNFAEASRLFLQADERLGGYPYEDTPSYDDEGRWVHAADRQPIRDSFQCPWALAVLSTPPSGDSEEAERARDDAMSRAHHSCPPADQARAALVRGDELQAALRAANASSTLATSEAATRWAASVRGGTLPIARDASEAVRFVTAHASAEHGLATRCGAPFGRRVRAAATDPMAVYDEDEESPTNAFESGTPDAIAFVRCTFDEPISPYEEPRMGPGAESVEYLLVRDATGSVRVAGPFRGMTDWECWTGVIQGDLGHGVVRLGGSARLYTVTRVEGYSTFEDDEESYVAEDVVVCDPARGACRTVPIAVSRTTVSYTSGEPVATHTEWRSQVRFTGGRVRLTVARGAPAPLQSLTGRGMTLDAFFAAPPLDARQHALYPRTAATSSESAATTTATTTAAQSAAALDRLSADAQAFAARREETATCPWRVADADGATNVRADASSRAAVAATIANGTSVTVTERRGRWWRVTAPAGQSWGTGWVWAPNLAQRCP